MYEKRGTIYADPGNVLVSAADGKTAGLSAAGRTSDFTEKAATLTDMTIDHGLGLALWGGGTMACSVIPGKDYAWYKTRLVKRRYSNDDQLAVMLNGDAAEMRRMQQWRQWASDVAKAICSRLGQQTE